jgi:hypothetical protein
MKHKFFMMLIMMLVLTGLAMAETNNTEINDTDINDTYTQALSVRYEHLQCKTDFTIGQIELLEEYIPEAVSDNFSSSKNRLDTEMDKLKDYVDDANKNTFDSYLANTFRPDFQKITQELNSIKKDFRKYNVSNETKTEFIDELKDLKEDYTECISDKEIKMGTVMEKHMGNWNKQWENVIERMKQKGMNTTEMEVLIAEINAKNQELNALLESKNITNLGEFIKGYRDDSLHYAAKLEIGKLKSYKVKLDPELSRYNLSKTDDNVSKHIEKAEKYTQAGDKYQEGEFEDSWNEIGQANKDMKDMSKNVLKERAKERMHAENDIENDTDVENNGDNDVNESENDDNDSKPEDD